MLDLRMCLEYNYTLYRKHLGETLTSSIFADRYVSDKLVSLVVVNHARTAMRSSTTMQVAESPTGVEPLMVLISTRKAVECLR
jgi:hypothetical protein